jgi:uncharacterized protein
MVMPSAAQNGSKVVVGCRWRHLWQRGRVRPRTLLVGAGLAVGTVAPAALASIFVTSTWVPPPTCCRRSVTRARSRLSGRRSSLWARRPDRGYLDARLQPKIPETALRLLLGSLAIGISVLYLAEALR